jgi:hypothetical protein
MKVGAVSLSFTKLIKGVPQFVIQPTAYFLLCYNYIGLFSQKQALFLLSADLAKILCLCFFPCKIYQIIIEQSFG